MKIPAWIKKLLTGDPVFRGVTIFAPIVAMIWDFVMSIYMWSFYMGTTVLVLIGLIVMYGVGYLERNEP